MSIRLFPYAVIRNGIEVTLSVQNRQFELRDTVFHAYEPIPEEPFDLLISAMLPSSWEDKVLPQRERKHLEVSIIARLISIESQSRQAVELTSKNSNLFEGSIRIDPALLCRRCSLEVFVVRSKAAHKPALGFAADAGARLAWSEEYQVLLSRPEPASGLNELKVLWLDFAEHTELAPFSQGLWHLEKPGDQPPRLFLNKGISNPLYKIIMETRAYKQDTTVLRDLIFAFLSAQVWAGLLRDILLDFRSLGETRDYADLPAWQRGAIEAIVGNLYPGFLPNDAKQQLIEDLNDEGMAEQLFNLRIPLAAQVSQSLRSTSETMVERMLRDE